MATSSQSHPIPHSERAPQPIPRVYTGKTAVLLADGPSLGDCDKLIEECYVPHEMGWLKMFGCNDTYRRCDFLDHIYAPDIRWIQNAETKFGFPQHYCSPGVRWTACKGRQVPEGWCCVRVVSSKEASGLSTNPWRLNSGGHAGFQLINIAYLMGCDYLILLGYDVKDHGQHWYGPWHDETWGGHPFEAWIAHYRGIAQQAQSIGLTIVNATLDTMVPSQVFPRVPFLEALAYARIRHTLDSPDTPGAPCVHTL